MAVVQPFLLLRLRIFLSLLSNFTFSDLEIIIIVMATSLNDLKPNDVQVIMI